jgi:hypothetical protein
MDVSSGSRVGGEVVTVQMGTYANDVGAHYWNLLTTAGATTSARGKVDQALLVSRCVPLLSSIMLTFPGGNGCRRAGKWWRRSSRKSERGRGV